MATHQDLINDLRRLRPLEPGPLHCPIQILNNSKSKDLYHSLWGYNSSPSSFFVPCGKCPRCLRHKQASWRFRLTVESLKSKSVYFVTLTLNPENYEQVSASTSYSLRAYFERCRYLLHRSPRHWLVPELGEKKGRLHFHALFFDLTLDELNLCLDAWTFGFTSIRAVTPRTINYVTKYMTKNTSSIPIRIFASPCLGLDFLTENIVSDIRRQYSTELTKPVIVNLCGRSFILPRYYIQRLFSSMEKASVRGRRSSLLGTPPGTEIPFVRLSENKLLIQIQKNHETNHSS